MIEDRGYPYYVMSQDKIDLGLFLDFVDSVFGRDLEIRFYADGKLFYSISPGDWSGDAGALEGRGLKAYYYDHAGGRLDVYAAC